jgi:hypothetical protein
VYSVEKTFTTEDTTVALTTIEPTRARPSKPT